MRAERLKIVWDDVVAVVGPLRGPTARTVRHSALLWFPVRVVLLPVGINWYNVEDEVRN